MRQRRYIIILFTIFTVWFFNERSVLGTGIEIGTEEKMLVSKSDEKKEEIKVVDNREEEMMVFKTNGYINKKSIIPKKKAEVFEETTLIVEAKIRNDKKAKAYLNGEKYDMVLVDEKKSENEDIVSHLKYRAFIRLQRVDKRTSLGHICIEVEGTGERVYGGEVIVKPHSEVKYDILINEGASKIYDGDDTSYVPLAERGPLPSGTLLEQLGGVTIDDKEYYLLKSGDRVKKEDCREVLRVLNITKDKNVIRDIKIEESERFTTLKLKEDYKGEFKLTFCGSFFKDYKNKKFEVIAGKDEKATIIFVDGKVKYFKKIKGGEGSLIDSIKKQKDTLKIEFKDSYYGYSSFYDNDGVLNIKFKKKLKKLKDAKIVIDPGHGMTNTGILDSGALGFYNITEHMMNKKIAKILEGKLKNSGASVIRLRTSEKIYNLKDRQRIAYIEDADMFISIHHNAGTKDMISTETYYNSDFSKNLAKNINTELVKVYKEDIFKKSKSSYDGGAKWDYYTVLLDKYVPSVLVEVGYIDNLESFNKLTSEEGKWAICNGIYKGIEKYILE